ncbi:MAG: hypothetical protein OXB88_02310 [Bacteriovoracales bacterium]|nr:hypothetical protein [Bacteriovoracales bacterium]
MRSLGKGDPLLLRFIGIAAFLICLSQTIPKSWAQAQEEKGPWDPSPRLPSTDLYAPIPQEKLSPGGSVQEPISKGGPRSGPTQHRGHLQKPTDLIFQPTKGEWILVAGYFTGSKKDKWKGGSSHRPNSKTKWRLVNYSAGYSFEDSFHLNVRADLMISGKKEIDHAPDYKFKGLSDPYFSLTYYRSVEGFNHPFDVNFVFKTSPYWRISKKPTRPEKGNNAKGRAETGIGFKLGQKRKMFSWAFGMEVYRLGISKSKIESDEDVIRESAHNLSKIEGGIQWSLMPQISLDFSTGYLRKQKHYEIRWNNKTPFPSFNAFVFEGGVNFEFSKRTHLTANISWTSSKMGNFGKEKDYELSERALSFGAITHF